MRVAHLMFPFLNYVNLSHAFMLFDYLRCIVDFYISKLDSTIITDINVH